MTRKYCEDCASLYKACGEFIYCPRCDATNKRVLARFGMTTGEYVPPLAKKLWDELVERNKCRVLDFEPRRRAVPSFRKGD